jgi:hypothetical protein
VKRIEISREMHEKASSALNGSVGLNVILSMMCLTSGRDEMAVDTTGKDPVFVPIVRDFAFELFRFPGLRESVLLLFVRYSHALQ